MHGGLPGGAAETACRRGAAIGRGQGEGLGDLSDLVGHATVRVRDGQLVGAGAQSREIGLGGTETGRPGPCRRIGCVPSGDLRGDAAVAAAVARNRGSTEVAQRGLHSDGRRSQQRHIKVGAAAVIIGDGNGVRSRLQARDILRSYVEAARPGPDKGVGRYGTAYRQVDRTVRTVRAAHVRIPVNGWYCAHGEEARLVHVEAAGDAASVAIGHGQGVTARVQGTDVLRVRGKAGRSGPGPGIRSGSAGGAHIHCAAGSALAECGTDGADRNERCGLCDRY